MTDNYILKDKKIVKCDDLIKWANWFEKADRNVAVDSFDDIMVSTVFLGLNHQFGNGPPLLFETMVFGGELDQEMDRYSTWDEAIKGHKIVVQKAKGG